MEHYHDGQALGQGAFGLAKLVVHKRTKRKDVVKEIMVAHLPRDEKIKAQAEAHQLKKLSHSNIVSYHDSFQENSNLYIVMGYADGGDLSDKITQVKASPSGCFEEDEVMAIFVQICLALKYVHAHKVLHRDFKTQNIFLTRAGIVKLGDFGVAKVLESTMAQAQTQIGTPYYLSPEICRGEKYERKSDIWSLGCVLYEMLAMQAPFKAPNLPVLIKQIVSASPAPLKSKYSSEARNLAFTLLTKQPEMRPSASQILKAAFCKRHTKSLLTMLEQVHGHTLKQTRHDEPRQEQPGKGCGHGQESCLRRRELPRWSALLPPRVVSH